jgi:hypothetical protein
VRIAADLGEKLAVDVGPFVDLCVGEAPLVDQAEQAFLEAFSDL